MSEAGWYPDPDGSPLQRYWDGTAWTEHTRDAPDQPGYSAGHRPTTPLPMVAPEQSRSSKNWYRRKAFFIPAAIVGLLVIVGALGAALGSPKKTATGHAIVVTSSSTVARHTPSTPSARPTSHVSSKPAARSTVPPTVASSKAAPSAAPTDDGSFVMPNELGKVLQDAQDDLQRVSGDPIFVSHSHDLLGSRLQVLDRNWKVCNQNVAAGSTASEIEHIDFGVVKLDESCP